MRWLLFGGVIYLTVVTVFWTILAVTAAVLRTVGRGEGSEVVTPPACCPICAASVLYVDVDRVCFCVTCGAWFPESNLSEAR